MRHRRRVARAVEHRHDGPRERVEDQPVAICRLKRVAADHKDDVRDRLPKAPAVKNGKNVAIIGAGGPIGLMHLQLARRAGAALRRTVRSGW